MTSLSFLSRSAKRELCFEDESKSQRVEFVCGPLGSEGGMGGLWCLKNPGVSQLSLTVYQLGGNLRGISRLIMTIIFVIMFLAIIAVMVFTVTVFIVMMLLLMLPASSRRIIVVFQIRSTQATSPIDAVKLQVIADLRARDHILLEDTTVVVRIVVCGHSLGFFDETTGRLELSLRLPLGCFEDVLVVLIGEDP
jgi:hypothetical protein